MPDYIFNNFSASPDKDPDDPINIYFKTEKKKTGGIKTVALICVICFAISIASGILGAFAITSFADNTSGSVAPTVITNTIYKSSDVPASANERDDESGSSAYSEVVQSVANSVVEIQTQYVVSSFYQYVSSGAGSGVIIGTYEEDGAKKGYNIITNAHVIESTSSNKVADSIKVILRDGTSYTGSVVGYDTEGDIAVIRIEEPEKELTCATFGSSDDLKVGEEVIAIGNPLGELGGSVTNGIISALGREINVDGNIMTLLQTNAAINPGNSGGGLFNLNGDLIAIVNAKSSGSNIEGLGFAIPAKDASKIANDLINYGYVKGRPCIGISNLYYSSVHINGTKYVTIGSVTENMNDDVLKQGDKIVSIDGQTVSSYDDLVKFINGLTVGSDAKIVVIRDKSQVELTIKIFERTK